MIFDPNENGVCVYTLSRCQSQKIMMKRKRSCEETTEEWKKLLEIPQVTYNNAAHPNIDGTDDNYDDSENDETEDDPFDCKSLAVPPTRTLVDNVLNEHVQKWKRLDERKLINDLKKDDDIATTAAAEKNNQKKKKGRRGGWQNSHQGRQLILPPNFDYQTLLNAPPTPPENDDMVMNLLNPTEHSFYSQELWKLFASVPSAETIHDEARSNAKIPNTMSLHKEIREGKKKNDKMDAHCLSRLRMSERHGLPPVTLASTNDRQPTTSTIRIEFWKRQLKRSSGPENRRMVLEFLASQTLLDVHAVIVEMLEDDLWTTAIQPQQEQQQREGKEEQQNMESSQTTRDNVGHDSGCFFIENQFYITGTVDYSKPILEWIDGGQDKSPNPARRRYLGILNLESIKAEPMKDKTLGQIPFRLGIRYYHVTHGIVETCFFVTDQRLTNHANVPYPIIHDVWTPTYKIPICNVCEKFPAEYVYFDKQNSVIDNCKNQQEKVMCANCCSQLKLLEGQNAKDIQLYHVWKNQSELSAGLARQEERQSRLF